MISKSERLQLEVERARDAHKRAMLEMSQLSSASPDFDSVMAKLRAATDRYQVAVEAHVAYLARK
jgi:hypothetical protein